MSVQPSGGVSVLSLGPDVCIAADVLLYTVVEQGSVYTSTNLDDVREPSPTSMLQQVSPAHKVIDRSKTDTGTAHPGAVVL